MNFHLVNHLGRTRKRAQGFPGGPGIKNPPCNAGDTGLIPSLVGARLSQGN